MKLSPITIAVLVTGLPGALWLHIAHQIESERPPEMISLRLLDLDQGRFYDQTLKQIEPVSGFARFEPAADGSLSKWLLKSAAQANSGGALVTEKLLEKLSTEVPQISSATACVAYAAGLGPLSERIAGWASGLDPSFSALATYVFADHGGRQLGCAAVAVERLRRFSPELVNRGEKSFYSICRLCNQSHIGTFEQSRGAAALTCPHCKRAYVLLAFKLDGTVCYASDLLTGWTPPVRIPKAASKLEEMFLIWKAVLKHVRYAKDLDGIHGTLDTWQLASETWEYKNGDCEDSSILLADWLIARGFDARVVIGTTDRLEGHSWCVVTLNGSSYILETTGAEPDIRHPPYAATLGRRYIPKFQFNRTSTYFKADDSQRPRYWSTKSWYRIDAESSPSDQ